jgi:RNA ligase (TIGR02306 family)
MARKLARIVQIDSVRKHPNADTLDLCMIGGWQVVTRLGEYTAGDYAIYLEVDSWVPVEVAPFLVKTVEPREYNGIKGERLRTVKLRGEVSQGLLLPLNDYPAVVREFHKTRVYTPGGDNSIDVTDVLGIVKYEAPIPACLNGVVKGNWPVQVPKTDEERIQNLTKKWPLLSSLVYEVTEKLEGSSMTAGMVNGDFIVCSRNLNLAESADNSLWKQARRYDLENKLRAEGIDNLVFQGELIGEGVEDNHYGIKGQDFYVYSVYDVARGCYLSPRARREIVAQLGLKHVPVIAEEMSITDMSPADILEFADGNSLLAATKLREGVVFKNCGPTQEHWKAVSNKYLLKHGTR